MHLLCLAKRHPHYPLPSSGSSSSVNFPVSQINSTVSGNLTSLSSDTATNRALSSLLSQVLAGARSSTIDQNHLFWIMLVSGNISHCQGCGGKILRDASNNPLPPPDDDVLQHKEQVLP